MGQVWRRRPTPGWGINRRVDAIDVGNTTDIGGLASTSDAVVLGEFSYNLAGANAPRLAATDPVTGLTLRGPDPPRTLCSLSVRPPTACSLAFAAATDT
jgi:hypothetical protein